MLASRTFAPDDQLRFGGLTGDINPMHMDPLVARRTQAGAPVVHGVHLLLWLLDTIAAHHPNLPAIATLKARFTRMVYVGEHVKAAITRLNTSELRAEVSVDGGVAVQLTGTFGLARPAALLVPRDDTALLRPTAPFERSMEDLEGLSGNLAFATSPDELEQMFLNAARLIGPRRVASLGCSTFLVGMAVPGLHSIYGSLALALCEDNDPADCIAFKVTSTDPRFRLVRLEICGGGLSGSLDTFVRQPPTAQPSLEAVARLISRDEFAGAMALIIGGSRGLGELTAKAIAAGGGKVAITYAVGKAEAQALAAEITAWGGTCKAIPYDARQDAEKQLSALTEAHTHVYYFATPIIFGRKSERFSYDRFNDFNAFYVSGFYRLVEAALRRHPEGIRVFYPSSVSVDDRPANMTEYTMSKVAGEILCADINSQMRKVRVIASRLPRLPTDQTATLQQVETADPLAVMLPIIRDVQG